MDVACKELSLYSTLDLGGIDLVNNLAFVCKSRWLVGEFCDRNPCLKMGIDCSGNGKCVTVRKYEDEATYEY